MRFDSDIHMTMACIWPRGQCGNGPVTYMSRNRSYRFSFLLMFSVSFVLGLLVILLSASYLFPCLQSLRVTSAVTLYREHHPRRGRPLIISHPSVTRTRYGSDSEQFRNIAVIPEISRTLGGSRDLNQHRAAKKDTLGSAEIVIKDYKES